MLVALIIAWCLLKTSLLFVHRLDVLMLLMMVAEVDGEDFIVAIPRNQANSALGDSGIP